MTVIVISGMPGCGSSTTARLLSERLQKDLFITGDYVKSLSEGKETERAIKMWRTEEGSSKPFHEKIDYMQKEKAREGNIIIESKLGIKMLGDLADYKIWLKAPEETRASRYAKRDGNHYEKAKQQLEEKEMHERESWKKLYGFDFFEQEKEADLVIDTSDKSPEDIVDIIIEFMEKQKK